MPDNETTTAAVPAVETIRERLRYSTTAHDAEIAEKIAVAKAELARVGIDPDSGAPLVSYAVELFCKGAFNFDGNGDAFLSQFDHVRDSMKLTDAYRPQPEANADG
jgi:hypothetical protein